MQKGTRAGQADAPLQCVPECDKSKGEVRDSKTGQCVTEEEPNMNEPNHESCGTSGINPINGESRVGAVSCQKNDDGTEDRYVCFWSNNIPGWKYFSNNAKDVIQYCAKKHEIHHKYSSYSRCNERTGFTNSGVHEASEEAKAYQIEAKCYADKIDELCKNDSVCREKLERELRGMFDSIFIQGS